MIEVTDDTFTREVLESDRPVLVDFWAEWCPPCHRLSPLLDELATEYEGRVRIVKLDVDANPRVTREYGVLSMPTLTVFHKGQIVVQTVGARPKPALRALLDNALEALPAR